MLKVEKPVSEVSDAVRFEITIRSPRSTLVVLRNRAGTAPLGKSLHISSNGRAKSSLPVATRHDCSKPISRARARSNLGTGQGTTRCRSSGYICAATRGERKSRLSTRLASLRNVPSELDPGLQPRPTLFAAQMYPE